MEKGRVVLAPAKAHPRVGAEIPKTRPCVIVSPREMHDHLRTVLAAPMTTGSRPAPYRIPVRLEEKARLILLDQIRALDKHRLVRRLGKLPVARYGKVAEPAQGLCWSGKAGASRWRLVRQNDKS